MISNALTGEEHPVNTVDSAIDLHAARISIRVRRVRRNQGVTLVQLAVSSDLSHSFLSQLESRPARPSMTSLEKTATAPGSSQLEYIATAPDEAADQSEIVAVQANQGTRGSHADGEGRWLSHMNRRGCTWATRSTSPEASVIDGGLPNRAVTACSS